MFLHDRSTRIPISPAGGCQPGPGALKFYGNEPTEMFCFRSSLRVKAK